MKEQNQQFNQEQSPITRKEFEQNLKVINMTLIPLSMLVFFLAIINAILIQKVYHNWLITILFIGVIIILWILGWIRQNQALKLLKK